MAFTNSPDYIPGYALAFKNGTDHPFALFDAKVKPVEGSHDVPPKDFVLEPHADKTMTWPFNPPTVHQRQEETFGYMRFWAKRPTPLPGSGTIFGVKIEDILEPPEVIAVEAPQVLKYVGSPTGDLKEWTNITSDVAPPGATFHVKGESITVYDVHVESVPPEERPFPVTRVFIRVTITAVYVTEEDTKA